MQPYQQAVEQGPSQLVTLEELVLASDDPLQTELLNQIKGNITLKVHPTPILGCCFVSTLMRCCVLHLPILSFKS